MCTINMEETGCRIRRFRLQNNMTIAEVQQACGVTAAAVCKWQRGAAIPSIDNLVVLAEIWHVTIDELIATE